MIQIINRNLQPLIENHWNHIENHFKNHTNSIRFEDINRLCMKIEPGFSFEMLIKANYQKLRYIKEKIYPRIKKIPNYNKCSEKIKAVYNDKFSKSNSHIGEYNYNAIEFVDNLDISVCPYCNRNYIDTREYNNVKKSGCQIDHFYDKYSYPLLALSFYNLVPVCPSCNHTKATKEFFVSPFDETKKTDDIITFDWEPIDSDYLQSKDDVKLIYKCDMEMKHQFEELKLEKPYKMHNDIIYEIIKKTQLYNNIRLLELKEDFPGIPFNQEETIKILFGVYLDSVDYLKRPLSKLTYDIVKKEVFNK
ncbi:hypothetical protein [Clostridium magnum]|uniref:HNH domain-containing protein n=1 Tax=Clostridium magnum DSM 2767 TaxID=1121326 RepID=A0A162R499_9CLOT|nr:hypothetical protein [Clostridium magnum]KZL89401.1 hypothetical protein CLMAG_53050 [Clostridium magnum DSM 2767]SHI20650.1 hypothetical protein SAMN02745944_03213 [Clostridium magnum DSM 2767]